MIKSISFASAVIALILNTVSLQAQIQTVKISGGKAEGIITDGVVSFKGIPFAAPPTGDLRWRPPQPVKQWKGILKADHFAPACPQLAITLTSSTPQKTSEDCLYLNIWTPAKSAKNKLPVMVWIHGGGFVMGSTSVPNYDGEQLAKMGVVVVSIGYRLGVLGFLAHPELSAESAHKVSGNYGLLDLIEGLKWIRKNIKAFGGDPGRVTIFGESSGGSAVSMLSASPLAKGLFFGAICESGGNFNPVKKKRSDDGIPTLEIAEKIGVEFAGKMGVSTIAELRKINPEKWNNDQYTYAQGNFQPVVDWYVILGDQYNLYEKGKYNDVHVMVGSNSDEGATFGFMNQTKLADFESVIKSDYGPFAGKFLELYPGNTEKQFKNSLADITRDKGYAWPSWTWARLQRETGRKNVYLYYFDQQQEAGMFMNAPPRGAGHGAEIPYVFKNLDRTKKAAEDFKLSDQMAQYWVNFAKTGNPNSTGLPDWPVFNENKQSVMYFHANPQAGPVPNLNNLLLMEEYFKWKRNALH